jgi:ATP-binding cassette subfamily F protein 3
MRAKDVLLEALAAFSGTVVFVSHDRYFIDRLGTRVLEVENGTVTSHEGNYEDYLRWKAAQVGGGTSNENANKRIPESASVSRSSSASKNVLYKGTALAGPKTAPPKNGASAPVGLSPVSPSSNTIVIEGGPDDARKRRLNPIKQKQMEERCAFLEEEAPRIESALAHTEEQLGTYASAAETQRLTTLAEDLRAQLRALTAEWEDLMLQLEA